MKYCPTCETRYDEDILRFCMKDGTPLLDEAEPNFIQMPSKSLEVEVVEDDPGEETVIRRNIPVPPLPTPEEDFTEDFSISEPPQPKGQRIVVPTFEEQQRQERARIAAQYQQPKKSNTILVVFLTMFGTIILIGVGALGFWVLQRDRSANSNINANANANSNANMNANVSNTLFDFNTNGNFNSSSNVNSNANVKTPTPTPRPSVTPTPTPDDNGTPTPTPSVNIAPATPRPSPSGTPRPERTPPPSTVPTPRTIITPSNRP